ncbi:MAG: hypothetical protein COV91_03405 [Candidatus Taylorbacteria bacterium CG11_big_fil_rev_8_21_14_0_20_46_11]|uniref:Uncharacterized protein n=1 Tax=Candidatus Taylorbacteria bacterium CG11_big_fil_rev_8_21_14_0_20_46_11 TaxID=1975025 RepID=A0A2H0KBA4_9BACT|nr:MAG: hypothetical protein COV91_03405 [Candidatus Taylorbacteria bacterium CG11_big_fil_rev_8_21_14_0_20_46_11]
MLKWKDPSNDDLKRLRAISILLGEDERLIRFLFHPTKSRLAFSPQTLKRKMKCFSSGEQTLLLIAMDIWGSYGGIHFDDLYTVLDPNAFKNCINSLAYIKRHLYH